MQREHEFGAKGGLCNHAQGKAGTVHTADWFLGSSAGKNFITVLISLTLPIHSEKRPLNLVKREKVFIIR